MLVMLEVPLAVAAVAACYVVCSLLVSAGEPGSTGGTRSRALELLSSDLGEAGRAAQRTWRPGSWRALH
jgi:hypothetical protein